ncbi:MAG: anthranilate synthase component I family protein [Opitutaceae bacterium]|nr:anthranilate synthase component I family protein [Cytophagales bacterium]
MRIKKKYHLKDLQSFKKKALKWGSSQTHCCYLNGNSKIYSYESFPEILAVGCVQEFTNDEPDFTDFLNKVSKLKDWAFGFLGYNSRDVEMKSAYFLPGLFFVPSTIITFSKENIISVETNGDPEMILKEINDITPDFSKNKIKGAFIAEISRDEYIKKIRILKSHLQRGDIYQINYCIKFESEGIYYDPYLIYDVLNLASPMPFSGFFKARDYCIVCASPERFLKKLNAKIISQPMKGTSPVFADQAENIKSISDLKSSEKERAENIMIVDLVRNDLSTICQYGTVKVEKLCDVYSFQNVHQMVSTVTGKLAEDLSTAEIFAKTFPMGSMTGAPKIRAMQLIVDLEISSRGPFSGTMGFMDPKGNFDFNVLIRSMFYNSHTGKGFYSAGSGITILSDPEKEYEECMLKGETLKNIFNPDPLS